jgi:hypothetical protein
MHGISNTVYGFAVMALAAATACGSDSASPQTGSDSLTPAEARVVANALFGQIAVAAAGSSTPSSSTIPATQSATGTPTVTATVNANCAGGGTIKGSYIFNNDVNASGTGTRSGSVTVSASNCTVSTGQRTITTDGAYVYTFSASFTNNALSSNFAWHGGGTFTWTGGACTLDYTVTVTPQGSKSLSGTICGVDVTGTAT